MSKIDTSKVSKWFSQNRNQNWCQPVQVAGRWYAACQNGVDKSHKNKLTL